jgi:hypothetical protein
MVVGVAACMLIALALQNMHNRAMQNGAMHNATWRRTAAASAVFAALIVYAALLFFQTCDDEDAVAAQVAAFRGDPAAAHIEGTDEYTPSGVDNSLVQQGLPMVRVLKTAQDDAVSGSPIANPNWRPEPSAGPSAKATVKEDNAEHWEIRVESDAPGYAVLRLMDYPAWRVTRNGKSAGNRPHRDDGLMTIPVAQGVNEVDVRWGTTGDVRAGRAASGIALALLAACIVEGRRQRRKKAGGGSGARSAIGYHDSVFRQI